MGADLTLLPRVMRASFDGVVEDKGYHHSSTNLIFLIPQEVACPASPSSMGAFSLLVSWFVWAERGCAGLWHHQGGKCH